MIAVYLGRKTIHKTGGWLRVVLLLLATAFLWPATMRSADDKQPAAPPKPIMGEISSQESFSYRVGVSGWLAQSGGTFPVVTPVEVRTAKSYCRVSLESHTLIQGAPSSEFDVSRTENGGLRLNVKKGSVLYALAEGAVLKITAGKAMHTASAGEVQTAKTAAVRPVFSYAAHSGIVVVGENTPAEWHNLKGRLVANQEGNRSVVVPVGQFLRAGVDSALSASAAAPPTAAVSDTGRAPAVRSVPVRSVGSWYVFEPNPTEIVDLGPGLVVLPQYNDRSWPASAPPPQVRTRMSPWMPPGRRRGTEPEPPTQPPANQPWVPPVGRR